MNEFTTMNKVNNNTISITKPVSAFQEILLMSFEALAHQHRPLAVETARKGI